MKKHIIARIKYKIDRNMEEWADNYIVKQLNADLEEQKKADMMMEKAQERINLLKGLLKKESK